MKSFPNNMFPSSEGSWDEVIRGTLDAGAIPLAVQERLNNTYASLGQIPRAASSDQELCNGIRVRRHMPRASSLVAAVLVCVLFAGTAFAAASLIPMGQGDGAFFAAEKNLPVYNSMESGAKALSAEIGQSVELDDMQITIDSVSCDRNVANLYVTLSKQGGFDLRSQSMYEGSQEAQWARIQQIVPRLTYSIESNDGASSNGVVNLLDAYVEGDVVKCLMRITPEQLTGTEAQFSIDAIPAGESQAESTSAGSSFLFGLDMTNVSAPRELGCQDVAFPTEQGNSTLNIERFTASELATVMIVQGDSAQGETAIAPDQLLITDSVGNTLVPVNAGDGTGIDLSGPIVTEYAGLSPEAKSVTFTPVIKAVDAAEDEKCTVDVSATGAKIETSDLGGYEVKSWSVEDSTVSITLAPYGWLPHGGNEELIPMGDVPVLEERERDEASGVESVGLHSALWYSKTDYATGEVTILNFYYWATEEELRAIHKYAYYAYPKGSVRKDESAAVTLSFE